MEQIEMRDLKDKHKETLSTRKFLLDEHNNHWSKLEKMIGNSSAIYSLVFIYILSSYSFLLFYLSLSLFLLLIFSSEKDKEDKWIAVLGKDEFDRQKNHILTEDRYVFFHPNIILFHSLLSTFLYAKFFMFILFESSFCFFVVMTLLLPDLFSFL